MQVRSNHFCFTLNNFTQDERANIDGILGQHTSVIYCLYGIETGTQEETPHLQGYIQFSKRVRGSQAKNILGHRVHIEACVGTDQQNFDYCTKDSNFFEFGTRKKIKGRGSRGGALDWANIIAKINEGYSIMELAIEFPEQTIKFATGIMRLIKEYQKPDITPQKINGIWDTWEYPPNFNPQEPWNKSLWIKGPAGIGKTQWALKFFENPLFVTHIDDLKLFNNNHDGIIFDDISFKHWPRESQISIVDHEQPRSIHIRYGVVRIPANTKKIFTSNVNIFDEDDAIQRRYHRINMNSL